MSLDLPNKGQMDADDTVEIWNRDGSDPQRVEMNKREFKGEYRLGPNDGEAELRDTLSKASYTEKIVLEPGFENVTVSNGPLTIPEGTYIEGVAKKNLGNPTLKKGFDGDLIKYGDWVTIKNLYVDGQKGSYTGSGIVPSSTTIRNIYFETVISTNFEDAAYIEDETFLSTLIACYFGKSRDGFRNIGSNHGPHNSYIRCRFAYNERAGIDIQFTIDKSSFHACLIDQNEIGIDTKRHAAGELSIASTSFNGGTLIQRNDGPGINAYENEVSINLVPGSSISSNNKNVPSRFTTPAGDVHSETGNRIGGAISGSVESIRRYNSNGIKANLTVTGGLGNRTLPDTNIIELSSNDDKIFSGGLESYKDSENRLLFDGADVIQGADKQLRVQLNPDGSRSNSYARWEHNQSVRQVFTKGGARFGGDATSGKVNPDVDVVNEAFTSGVSTKTVAGVPSDSDFQEIEDGMLAVDTSNNDLYVRIGGSWLSVGVS